MYFSPGRILCETHMCVHQTETAENSRFVFADMILLTVLYLPLGLDKGNNETREIKKNIFLLEEMKGWVQPWVELQGSHILHEQ